MKEEENKINQDAEATLKKTPKRKQTTKKQLNFFQERELHHSQEIKRNQEGIKYADKRLKELERNLIKLEKIKQRIKPKVQDCRKHFVTGKDIYKCFFDCFAMFNTIIKDNQKDLKGYLKDNLRDIKASEESLERLDNTRNVKKLTRDDIRGRLISIQKGKCNCCGIGKTWDSLESDHIHPRSLGGSDRINNFQLLCGLCNKSKSDNSMKEFMAIRIKSKEHINKDWKTNLRLIGKLN